MHFLAPLFLTFYAKSLAVEDANAGLNFEDRSVGALPNWQVMSMLHTYFHMLFLGCVTPPLPEATHAT